MKPHNNNNIIGTWDQNAFIQSKTKDISLLSKIKNFIYKLNNNVDRVNCLTGLTFLLYETLQCHSIYLNYNVI